MTKSKENAVLAAFAGDSLALTAHWIYDTGVIKQEFGDITEPLTPRGNAAKYHPTKRAGDFTHYGDQTLLLLQYLAEHGGRFDAASFLARWREFWQTHDGYRDRATATTFDNLAHGKKAGECASPSTDLGGAVRFAPLLLCAADIEQLLVAVREQTQLTHNGPGIVDGALFLARSCHSICSGLSPRAAFELAFEEQPIGDPDLDMRLRKALDLSAMPVEKAAAEFGQMCAINAALPTAVYTVLQNENSLERALRENVMAGGDSAARGMAIGMLLGARLGAEAIPAHWLKKMNHYQEIEAYLKKLAE